MAKRQFLLLLSILLILMNFYFYKDMTDRFNENALIFQMDVKDHEDVEEVLKTEGIDRFMIEYTSNQSDIRYVSGKISDFYNYDLLLGKLDFGGSKREVVLGDRVADQYFKTIHCLEKTFTFANVDYDIVGVVKDSDSIFINYEKDLMGQVDRTTLYVLPPVGQKAEYYQDNLKYKLLKEQLNYTQFKLNKWYSDLFINLYVGLILIIVIYLMVMVSKVITDKVSEIIGLVKSERRTVTYINMIERHFRKLSIALLWSMIFAILGIILFKGFTYLRISSYFLPVNFLSLKDYQELFNKVFGDWQYAMTSGLYAIEIDYLAKVFINLILVSFSSLLYLIKYSFNEV